MRTLITTLKNVKIAEKNWREYMMSNDMTITRPVSNRARSFAPSADFRLQLEKTKATLHKNHGLTKDYINTYVIGVGMYFVIVVVLFNLSYFGTYWLLSHAPQENAERVAETVKAVCDYSYGNDSHDNGAACNRAQLTAHMEYVCNNGGCNAEEQP